MGEVDRQRISAVRALVSLGYTYCARQGWQSPQTELRWCEADELYALLTKRADRLPSVFGGTRDAIEYQAIVKALEAYEDKRWPDGKVRGGKG